MNVQKLIPAAELKLTNTEIAGTSLIVLAYALLPIGRTVEIPTVIMALSGSVMLFRTESRARFWSGSSKVFTMFFFLVWIPMAISVIDSENLANSAGFTLKYLRFFFAGLFALYFLRSQRIKEIVMAGLSITVGLWLVDSLIQWFLGIDLLGRVYDGVRVSGPFKNLILPVFLSLFLPLVLIYCKIKWPDYIFGVLCFTAILVLFLTGSRASLLALLLGAVLYGGYLFRRSEKRPWVATALLLIGVLAIAGAGYTYDSGVKSRIDRTGMILGGDYHSINEATSFRLPIWGTAYRMAVKHPINGVGIKSFRGIYSQYALDGDPFKEIRADHAHLFMLEVFAETGIIGLLSLLFFWVFFLKASFQGFAGWTPLQAGSAITISIAFFPLNSHVSIYSSVYSQVLWLMVAVCCAWLDDSERLILSGGKQL